jgi:hypothetical protein
MDREEANVQPPANNYSPDAEFGSSSPSRDPPPSDIRYSLSMTDEKISTISSLYPAEPDPVRSPPFNGISGSSIPSLGSTPPASPSGKVRTEDSNFYTSKGEKEDDVSIWEGLIESMRQAMRLQDEQIRALRKENNDLRRQLAEQRAGGSNTKRETEDTGMRSKTNISKEDLFELRKERHPTPNHRKFSPGTKFVAELSQMMDLEAGHFAALSSIMDKRLSSFEAPDSAL